MSTERSFEMVRLCKGHRNTMAPKEIVALETSQILHQYTIMSK